MHTNPAFRAATTDQNLAFARARGFGILMLNGVDGPLASHIPYVLSPDGNFADLHLTRSNPIARSDLPAPCLLAISGPDAYVSPDWYGAPDQVPTWNYVAVHLRGVLEALPPEALRPHLDCVSAHFEARLLPKKPWVADKMSEGVMDRMMRGILPFRLVLTKIDSTVKLNQNKTDEVRAAAADRLAGRTDAGSQGIAALMRG